MEQTTHPEINATPGIRIFRKGEAVHSHHFGYGHVISEFNAPDSGLAMVAVRFHGAGMEYAFYATGDFEPFRKNPDYDLTQVDDLPFMIGNFYGMELFVGAAVGFIAGVVAKGVWF